MDLTLMPGYVEGFSLLMGVRELGGWQTLDGRAIRHGLLFRGSALVGLTEEERSHIDALGLRFILDLRAAGECVNRTDYVPDGAEHVRMAGMYYNSGDEVDFSPAGIARIARQIDGDPKSFMSGLYASMMFGNPAVHALVGRLIEGCAPLYFHCTAGKDRTGVCATVLLMLLGVDDDAIIREFLLTNEYRASIINNPPSKMPKGLEFVTPQQWAQMNGVMAENLHAAFAAVDARYATREEYFCDEFGLDAEGLAALRDRYLV